MDASDIDHELEAELDYELEELETELDYNLAALETPEGQEILLEVLPIIKELNEERDKVVEALNALQHRMEKITQRLAKWTSALDSKRCTLTAKL